MKTRNTTALVLTSALAGGAAHGAIVYTNFSNLTIYGRDGTAEFDLSPDFSSHYFLLYQDSNSQKPEVRGDGTNSFVLARTWQDTNSMDLGNRTYGGLPLTPGGVAVNGQMHDVNAAKQQNGITTLTVQNNGYFNERPDNNDDDTGGSASIYNVGDWGNTSTNSAYVGLVMVNGGATNFGWAHFTWSDPSSNSQDTGTQLILIDGGYETTPNTAILTGAGSPTPPSFSTVPASQSTYTGASLALVAQADSALGYQWMAGAVGSGVYTNLSDSGNVSGTATDKLLIKSAVLANTADYVLVATNATGAVTSAPPATITIQTPGATPTTVAGWFNAFQAQTDFVYAGGQQNVSYQAANGKVYWLFNGLVQGTMDPTTHAFDSSVTVVDNRILLASGDKLVPTDLTLPTVASLPTDSVTYRMKDMFEAGGRAYVVVQKMDPFSHVNTLGTALAKYAIEANGALTFLAYNATPASNVEGGIDISNVEWVDGSVVQNGFVYFFGENQNADATYLARVATTNVENITAWTYWNGTTWDADETNSVAVINNTVSSVRLYQGAWVAVGKVYGQFGTDTYAYVATQPQGPYTPQFLFTDPTNDNVGVGATTNSATGDTDYYYSVNPGFHPEYALASGKLLGAIDYWDSSTSSYNSADAGLFKPRFYEVTLSGLPTPTALNIQGASGGNIVLQWSGGLLLEASSLNGPWTTNSATSPYTNATTGSQKFYRVLSQ